jgi:hypothetical protein
MNGRLQVMSPSNVRRPRSALRWLVPALVVLFGCDHGPIVVAEIQLGSDDGDDADASGSDREDAGSASAGEGAAAGDGAAAGSAGVAGSAGAAAAAGSPSRPACAFPGWIVPITQVVLNDCTLPISDEAVAALIEQLRRDNPQLLPLVETRGPEICDWLGPWVYRPNDNPDVLKVCPTPCEWLENRVRDTWAAYDACLDAQQAAP